MAVRRNNKVKEIIWWESERSLNTYNVSVYYKKSANTILIYFTSCNLLNNIKTITNTKNSCTNKIRSLFFFFPAEAADGDGMTEQWCSLQLSLQD